MATVANSSTPNARKSGYSHKILASSTLAPDAMATVANSSTPNARKSEYSHKTLTYLSSRCYGDLN